MKKFLPYILIVFTLVNFLAPVSIGLSEKNKVVVEKKVASAANDMWLKISASSKGTTITADVTATFAGQGINLNFVSVFLYDQDPGTKDNWKGIDSYRTKNPLFSATDSTNIVDTNEDTVTATKSVVFDKLSENKTYYLVGISAQKSIAGAITSFWNILKADSSSGYTDVISIPTGKSGDTDILQGSGTVEATNVDPTALPACSMAGVISLGLVAGSGTFVGCVAQTIYYVFFVPSSYVFALAGNFFDWTFAYSVNDASYRSGFVVQGWGVVRDFCNMFFIFILLYVAFTTILGTNGAKTKEMIVNVVIIGLLINFSLFATQIIIDASNILARVFYNSNTIVITQGGTNGQIDNTAGGLGGATTPSDPMGTGIIPLSSALVNKINPQNLIINANKVGDIQQNGNIDAAKNATNYRSLSVGRFIIVTLLATAVNVVGFVVFLVIAFVFVGRVVMLWIAMILSPIVFFTYMVPSLKTMDTIGWSKWWPETLKLAFLAPVFIFFLYIILKFLETDLVFIDSTGKTGIQMVIAVIVPFAFIMVLLLQAKKIATGMAGEMGKTMSKAGSTASGIILGAGVGVGAMAMRGTLGKMGDRLDKSSWVNKMAGGESKIGKFVGNKLKDTGQFVGKSSFDVRATSLGASASKELGVEKDIGKAKQGGYVKDRTDKVQKHQKRAKELEVHEDEKLNQDVNKLEMDLQSLLRENSNIIETLDKKITSAREESRDLSDRVKNDPRGMSSVSNGIGGFFTNKEAAKNAANKLDELKEHKKAIKTGKRSYEVTSLTDDTLAPGASRTEYITHDGTAGGEQTNVNANGRSINDIELEDIANAKNKRDKESRRRTTNYANNIVWLGGKANKEAKHKIIMGSKIDSGLKV